MAATRTIELRTEIPGPRSRAIVERSERAVASPLALTFPVVAESALGVTITDVDGNTLIDFAGGVGSLNVGHSHPDVVAAAQDANLAINQAKGYENEVIPRARAEAIELTESALAYRDAKIAESQGEAERFDALLVAYRAAPAVTRKRLYLETMEAVLPHVEKVIVEPGAASILPHLALGKASRGEP